MKFTYYLIFLITVIGCGEKTTINAKPNFEYNIDQIPSYTTTDSISIRGDFNFDEAIVSFYKNDNSCNEINWLGDADKQILNSGLTVTIDSNSSTMIYVKFTKKNNFGTVYTVCDPLAEVTHDNVAPLAPVIDAGVLSASHYISQNSVHIDFLNPLPNDAEKVEFYADAAATIKIGETYASLWDDGLGYFSPPQNAYTEVYVVAKDKAGNLSPANGPLKIYHDNISPSEVILDPSLDQNNGKVISSSTITLTGALDTDVIEVKVFSDSSLSTEVASYTKVAFETGQPYNLNTESVNYLYFVAYDQAGNQSLLKSLTLYHTSSPSVTHSISDTSLTFPQEIPMDVSGKVEVFINNTSVETTYNVFADISNVGVTTSSPHLTVASGQGCDGSSLEAGFSCSLVFNVNFNSSGTFTESAIVNFDGTSIPVTIDFTVFNPLIEESEKTDASSSSSTSFLNPTHSADKGYINALNGAYNLSNLSDLNTSSSRDIIFGNTSTSSNVIVAPKINGFNWFNLTNATSGGHDVTPGITPDYVESYQYGNRVLVRLLHSSGTNKLIILDETGMLISQHNYEIKYTPVANSQLYFINNNAGVKTLFSYDGTNLSTVSIPGFTILDDKLAQVGSNLILFGQQGAGDIGLYAFDGTNYSYIDMSFGSTPSEISEIKQGNGAYINISFGSHNSLISIDHNFNISKTISDSLSLNINLESLKSDSEKDILRYTTNDTGNEQAFMVYEKYDNAYITFKAPLGNYYDLAFDKNYVVMASNSNLRVYDETGVFLNTAQPQTWDSAVSHNDIMILSASQNIYYYNSQDDIPVVYYNIPDASSSIGLISHSGHVYAYYLDTDGDTRVKKLKVSPF